MLRCRSRCRRRYGYGWRCTQKMDLDLICHWVSASVEMLTRRCRMFLHEHISTKNCRGPSPTQCKLHPLLFCLTVVTAERSSQSMRRRKHEYILVDQCGAVLCKWDGDSCGKRDHGAQMHCKGLRTACLILVLSGWMMLPISRSCIEETIAASIACGN